MAPEMKYEFSASQKKTRLPFRISTIRIKPSGLLSQNQKDKPGTNARIQHELKISNFNQRKIPN
ncbi:MAG TPA: hypothetical protein VI819_01145 [Patescibacteria group bacterium]|nr:hypothetical protein [Patescibacteria group bacterium]